MDLLTLALPVITAVLGFGVHWLGVKFQWFGAIDSMALAALRAVESSIPDDTENLTQAKIDAALKLYLSMRSGTVSDAEIDKVKALLERKA